MANSQSLCSVLILSVLLHTAIGASDDPTLDVNPNAPKTRGSRFTLAFMQNNNQDSMTTEQQIGIFITTEQESSSFTLETRWPGVNGSGFAETSPGSGLWSRTEIARRGEFTFINLPAGRGGQQDIAVQNNGNTDEAERQKGIFITAEDPNDELTVYVLNDETTTTDAYMAINCVEFPGARDYKYFIFSSSELAGTTFQSRFLFTPCQDDTTVSVQASQTQTHPDWVLPSSGTSSPRVEATYGRAFNRFDTVMISNLDDLTGSIITSDKPLAVFSGHQCGAPTSEGTCDYLVEQLPPHPTYGDLFFMAPFAVRQSGELYRIGSVSAGAQVTINCECAASSADNRTAVALVSVGDGVYTATVGAGEYAECRTPQSAQTYCSVTSTQPVTMAGYTLGRLAEPVEGRTENYDPSLYYIPAANSYLNSYSFTTAKDLTTQFNGYLSYIFPTRIFDNSTADQQRFLVNGETRIPDDQYQAINCSVDGIDQVCAYGGTSNIGQGNFNLTYDNIQNGAFWGFAYGFAQQVSFAYPLPFELEPIGLAWIRAVDQVVLETVGTVDLMFSITRGDRSERSRAFADTQDLSAIEGSDYADPPPQNNGGLDDQGNLRWRIINSPTLPNVPYVVTILDDDIPEPVEVVEVIVQCVARENCYLPRTRYTITIIDDQGACLDLPAFLLGSISYDFRIFPEIGGRPYGTVATYMCDVGTIMGEPTRTCENGVWSGSVPSCGTPPAPCPELEPIPNGAITYGPDMTAPFNLGTNATHTCNDGFILTVGSETRECLPGGIWSGRIPVCQRIPGCPELEPIPNGAITYGPDMTADFDVGTNATHTCNDGFILTIGSETRECLPGGIWSGRIPVCQRIPECPELASIPNGAITYGPDMTADFDVGTNATHTCNEGFILTVGSETRECLPGGIWSGRIPVCQRIPDQCPPLSTFPNGMITYSSGPLLTFPVGTEAVYECNAPEGYCLPVDATLRECQPSGTWSGVEPVCERITCEIIVLVNGRVEYSGPLQVGATATQSCTGAGVLTGGRVRICTSPQLSVSCDTPGEWEEEASQCVTVVNDTAIGDPLMTVPLNILNKTSFFEASINNNIGPNDIINLCYELHGRRDAFVNLVSDECIGVNAHYELVQPSEPREDINIIDNIYVRATDNVGMCQNIRVALNEGGVCTASVNGADIADMYQANRISIRRYTNRVRIMVPNCENVNLVMWVFCRQSTFWSTFRTDNNGAELTFQAHMIKFVIARGFNLRETSHGIIGQFWNIPILVEPFTGSIRSSASTDNLYQVTIQHPNERREFTAWLYPLTWEHRREYCLYAGNQQAGSVYEVESPNDPVIEGTYADYIVDTAYGTDFTFTQFDEGRCSSVVIG